MKFSAGLLIAGGLVVAGATVYLVYQKKHTGNAGRTDSGDIRASEPHTVICPEEHLDEPKPQVGEVKGEVATSVVERHAVASETVGESMESIFSKDDDEVVITENTEKLKRIGEDLDKIL